MSSRYPMHNKLHSLSNSYIFLHLIATDLDILMEHTRYLVLLSKVYNRQNRVEDSLLHLTKAADLQNRVPRPQELVLHNVRISIAKVTLHLFPLVAYDDVNFIWRDKAPDYIDNVINHHPLTKMCEHLEERCTILLSWASG